MGKNTAYEKDKVFEELCSLIRVQEQKERVSKVPVKERIKNINKDFPRGKI